MRYGQNLLGCVAGLALSCAAAAADTARYSFEWQGSGGYVMRGAMAFPAELMRLRRVVETDLTCFEITGYQGEREIGRWALGLLLPDTTWRLTFDPAASEFVVYGPEDGMPQAWNMDGAGYNCGDPGFGFNIGSAAQDICVDGALIFASQVPPPTPFPARADPMVDFGPDACRPEILLGLDGF